MEGERVNGREREREEEAAESEPDRRVGEGGREGEVQR